MSTMMINQSVAGDEICRVMTLNRRDLVEKDLERMRIPKRLWKSRFSRITDEETLLVDGVTTAPVKDVIRKYLEKLDEMRDAGMGLLLWGDNGYGKSSIAVVIAKEYRRHFNTVLYVEAADLKRLVIEKEYFDEDETVWQRATSVDVLVLDDLGKGTHDSKGFGERLIDELIRTRNSKRLVTIITTNMRTRGTGDILSDVLKKSTMESLKEHVLPFEIRGNDQREEAPVLMMKKLFS